MNKFDTLMVLAPHTDDAELGCGATMARMLEDGVRVIVVSFSSAKESLPEGLPSTTLRDEFVESMRILGIGDGDYLVLDYPVRNLASYRQHVLEEILRLRRLYLPNIVLLPSGQDVHQDHQVVHLEGLRAFKDITILGYELPWNHITFSAQAFVGVSKSHVEKKWDSLTQYKSQLELGRNYFSYEFINGLARVRGAQVKLPYAEAYEVVRLLI